MRPATAVGLIRCSLFSCHLPVRSGSLKPLVSFLWSEMRSWKFAIPGCIATHTARSRSIAGIDWLAESLEHAGERVPLIIGTAARGAFRAASAWWAGGGEARRIELMNELRACLETWDGCAQQRDMDGSATPSVR